MMKTLDTRRMSASQIAHWASTMPLAHATDACLALQQDTRRCAQKAAEAIQKRVIAEQAEMNRLTKMFRYEQELWESGVTYIAGVDEVGRGPLAGPVVAAAVILLPGTYIRGLNDSKQVPEPERERLYEIIQNEACAIGVGVKDVEYIEKHNIAQASFAAMRDALLALGGRVEYVLVDGFKIPSLVIPQKAIIKGDALSNSIAAASIIAKVTRDHMMVELDQSYPDYGFARNKGYSTRDHLRALDTLGLCPEHRRTFAAVARAQMLLGLDTSTGE